MLPRILIAFSLVLAAASANAQSDMATNGAATVEDGAWTVEVVRGSEVWRDFGRNGRAALEIRMGRPGIRVHEAATRPEEYVRVHSATREPGAAAMPTHGVADAFDPSRLPVQRLHRTPGQTRIRTHGLADAGRRSGIRVHGFGGPRI
jgi:hypothetical protein